MPRGVRGSKTKAAKTEKRAPKTEESTVEINNPMNELLEALSEFVKEGVIALKRENAKHAQPAKAEPIPAAADEPKKAAEPKPAARAKKAPEPAPAPDPLDDLGLESTPEKPKAPVLTEAQSMAKMKETVNEYLDKFGQEKGVPAIRAILKANFKVDKLTALTHEQRVQTIAFLRDGIDA